MFKSLKLGTKIICGFLCVVALALIGGAIAFWGTEQLTKAAGDATARLNDAALAREVPYWAIKQYQAQADLIINRDMGTVKDFEEYAGKLDAAHAKLDALVDTTDEKAWLTSLSDADKKFDHIFNNGVVPEVKHQIENLLTKYDGEADALLSQASEAADSIARSIQAELQDAVSKNNTTEIIKRTEQLLATREMMYWLVKQYQSQADLIINQNLKSIDDFNACSAKMDEAKKLVAAAADTPEEKEWASRIDQADAAYNKLFAEKVVPEVKRVIENRIKTLDDESDKHLSTVDEMAGKIADSLKAEATQALEKCRQVQATIKKTVVAVCIVSAIVGVLLGLVITRGITKPINRIIAGLNEGADQVNDAASQVSTASQSLAAGASQQASALEETSSALEEMSSKAKAVADSTNEVDRVMREEAALISSLSTTG